MAINIEIERKFLVLNEDYKVQANCKHHILQGYISSSTGRTVRVRIKDDKAYLTIKGKSKNSGLSRFEWETEIPKAEAEQLLNLCEPGIIDKIRYEIPVGNLKFEVDEFFGDNEGLVIAEIELTHEEESFETPTWLGQEVTGNKKYYNSKLSSNPYKLWEINEN